MPGISLGTKYGVNNVIIPKGGPKVIPALLDFTQNGSVEIESEMAIAQQQIEFIQGIYIDNADFNVAMTLSISGTGQRIVAPPNSQGFYSIMATNPPRMVATMTAGANRKVPVIFYNVPIQPQVWRTI